METNERYNHLACLLDALKDLKIITEKEWYYSFIMLRERYNMPFQK